MKQYQYVGRSGNLHGPFTAKEVATRFPLSVRGVSDLAVGERYTDLDGDTWSIVPDLTAQQAERLERIATAAFSAIISKRPFFSGTDSECQELLESDARGAVIAAKSLIAELDKQS